MSFSPTLSLHTADGDVHSISYVDMLQKNPYTLLYFYPRDSTPGCTVQAQDFTTNIEKFKEKWVHIVGVSADDNASHEKFRISCALSIDLVADTDRVLIDHFQVMGNKSMYGKMIFGLLRSTFLLDSTWNILQEWRSVRAKWHVEKVLREIVLGE